MLTNLAAFATTYIYVALKALQQLNVVHGDRAWVVPLSMGMAACEVFTIGVAARDGWGWLVFWIGLGGGLGCLSSMWLHKRIRNDN